MLRGPEISYLGVTATTRPPPRRRSDTTSCAPARRCGAVVRTAEFGFRLTAVEPRGTEHSDREEPNETDRAQPTPRRATHHADQDTRSRGSADRAASAGSRNRVRRSDHRDVARRLGCRGDQDRASPRRSGPCPRVEQGRTRPVVEGDRTQQEHHHVELEQARRTRDPAPARRRGRRGDRKLSARRDGELGPRAGEVAADQPRSGHAARHRIRTDRPVRPAARLRHSGRGHERSGPSDRPGSMDRRRCPRLDWPTVSLA